MTRDVNGPGDDRDVLGALRLAGATGVIIGRLEPTDSRFMAITDDEELVALMSDGEPLGQRISVTSVDGVNSATL